MLGPFLQSRERRDGDKRMVRFWRCRALNLSSKQMPSFPKWMRGVAEIEEQCLSVAAAGLAATSRSRNMVEGAWTILVCGSGRVLQPVGRCRSTMTIPVIRLWFLRRTLPYTGSLREETVPVRASADRGPGRQ